MYTDNFEEEILFIPARKDGEACNHLKIVTAFTDVERISSHLIKLFDGRNKEYVSGIKVDIILGMTKGTGLTQKKHDKICSLIKRLNSVSGMPQISCNYIVEGKQVHSKVYVWCRGRKAIEAFNGSANYTMNAFFVRRECMDACNPKEANHYFNSLLPDTINCFDGQIKDKVSFSSKKNVEDDVADTNLENLSWENYRAIEPVDTLEVSLLKADGSDTGYGSGVNWGIRKNGYKRNRNQAYIPYNVADHKDGFFPDVNADGTYPVFKVVTKEYDAFYMRQAQAKGKALETPESNAIIGEWIRHKLGVPDGTYITKQMLDNLDLTSIKKVMITAHPDDETLWGGGHLIEGEYLVVCMTHGWNPKRRTAFEQTMRTTNDKYLILDYPDVRKTFSNGKYETDMLSTCKNAMQEDINLILSYKKWDLIATHNPFGEYGKFLHKTISQMVTQCYNKMTNKSATLYYFGRYYNSSNKIPGEQIAPELLAIKNSMVGRYYPTAKGAIDAFGHMIPYENWLLPSEW